jgi:hypothetical protein
MIGPGFAERLPIPTILKVLIILAAIGIVALIVGVIAILMNTFFI